MKRIARPSPAVDAVTAAEAARFAAALALLWPEGGRLGLAVSGGPDSLAMLLLAQRALPGRIAAATVDHGLRAESAAEAAFVAGICADLGVPHVTLPVVVAEGNLQDAARMARYVALGQWVAAEGLGALATAHHADDQAETLVMRLNRGSGLAGLAAVRARGTVPGSQLELLRPLLGWRRAELGEIVARAGIEPVSDPSNLDPRFDRSRIRQALAAADWLDVEAVAASAAHLAEADQAIEWLAERDWALNVAHGEGEVSYCCTVPRAVALRVVGRIIAGFGGSARGAAVARLVDALTTGEGATLAGVLARAERETWTFRPEPPRNA